MILYAFTHTKGGGYIVVAHDLDEAHRMVAIHGGPPADQLVKAIEAPIGDEPIAFQVGGQAVRRNPAAPN